MFNAELVRSICQKIADKSDPFNSQGFEQSFAVGYQGQPRGSQAPDRLSGQSVWNYV